MKSTPAGLSTSLQFAFQRAETKSSAILFSDDQKSTPERVSIEAIFADVSAEQLEVLLDESGLSWRGGPSSPGMMITSFTLASGEVRTFLSGEMKAEDIMLLVDLVPTEMGRFISANELKFIVSSGSVLSQGDVVQGSAEARAEYGVDGEGVTVGVLSDSFGAEQNSAGTPTITTVAQDIATGDLPTDGVLVLLDGTPLSRDGDEGRAMLQIIHDVAPGADLAFHTAGGGQAVFANGILELRNTAGADVIVDDIIYFAEPIFQDGIIAQAVNQVVADGAVYLSSAGNNGDDGFLDVFRDSGVDGDTVPALVQGTGSTNLGNLHDWNADPEVFSPYVELTLDHGEEFSLSFQWDEPYASAGGMGATADYDIFITSVDSMGNEVLLNEGIGFSNNLDSDPIEIVDAINDSGSQKTYRIYITQFDAPDNVSTNIIAGVFFSSAGGSLRELFDPEIVGANGVMVDAQQFDGPTVFGHANAEGALAVGAAAWFNTPGRTEFGFNPIDEALLSGFSSMAGFDVFFDEAGQRLRAPDERDGVDFVAPDGGNTTFFGTDISTDPDTFPNFFGTSAAAPHAAGVVALMLDLNPDLTAGEVEYILEQTAQPISSDSSGRSVDEDSTGAGLIDAVAALANSETHPEIPPVAEDDFATTDEDTPIIINVLGNDSDANEDPLSIFNFEGSDLPGELTLNEDGTFTYDPQGVFDYLASGESEIVTFTYEITDDSVTTTPGEFDAVFELSSLLAANGGDGSLGFVINGVDVADRSGWAVSSAGDINKDGIDDLIIGAYFADPNDQTSPGDPARPGGSYVVFGQAGGFGTSLDLSALDGTNGFIIIGVDGGDISGLSVSAAGDVNGDGIDDLIIGSPSADPNDHARTGESYVVFGTDQGFAVSLNLSSLDGSNGFALNGGDHQDSSGWAVSAAGDVNNDGIDDLIIGAPGADPNGQSNAGESYVVFGRAGGFSASMDLSSLDGSNGFVLNGMDGRDQSGGSVAAAGDINGDGVDDVIIGAPHPTGQKRAGESYVVFGQTDGFGASMDLSSLDGSNGFVLNGVDGGDRTGISVSAAGDVNGDGIDDLIIGAYRADLNGQSNAGESYVVFGQVGGFGASMDLSSLDGSNGFVLNGVDNDDLSGVSVSSAGDVNGDGIDDLIIGARAADPYDRERAGESYVVFGQVGGFTANLDLSSLDGTNGFVLNGINNNDRSGGSVSSAGDVNGDGIDDLIIGASQGDPNGRSNAGESYVVFGRASFDAIVDVATVTVEINGVNDAPVADDDSVITDEDVAVIISILSNDTDIDNDTLSVDSFTQGANGTVTDNGDGTLSYTGNADFNGTDNFTYTISDGNGGTDTATVNVTINPVADDPVNLTGTQGPDTLTGNDGDDTLNGRGNADLLIGLEGDDFLNGSGGGDTLEGGEGQDTLNGAYGNDVLNGNQGDDSLLGDHGEDIIDGGAGNDTARGGQNNDTITGGEGDDLLIGNNGFDSLQGDAGNDRLFGGYGEDTLVGGEGDDLLNGEDLHDLLIGGLGEDTLEGGTGRDTLQGGEDNDILRGNNGADSLGGNEGDDRLSGGNGNDTLSGDAGDDTLIGGNGDDDFIIDAIISTGLDIITDFVAGDRTQDVISLLNFGPSLDEFDEVVLAASDDGTDTTINLGNGNTLILQNVLVSELSEDDFDFVAGEALQEAGGSIASGDVGHEAAEFVTTAEDDQLIFQQDYSWLAYFDLTEDIHNH